jgi:hypothetical protein
MKKTLYFIAAITMAASPAMASKARVSALSSTAAITDIQNIFTNPADMHYVGDFVTFEMGATPSGVSDSTVFSTTTMKFSDATPNPEGGFITTLGEAKFGAYFGKISASTNILRQMASAGGGDMTGNAFLMQENPFEVFYGAKSGDLNWGASFSYSNSQRADDTATTPADEAQKQQAMGVRFGAKTDEWGAWANVGLGAAADTAGAKYTGKSGIDAGGHYMMDTMKFYGRYGMSGAKAQNAAGTEVFNGDLTDIVVGLTNSWKKDGDIAFYGISYKMSSVKLAETGALSVAGFSDGAKIEIAELPVIIGAEVASTPWMTLRGSISQNVLTGSKKVTLPPATAKANTVSHNTVTAAGAGFKWGHNNIDAVMTMGTSAGLDATSFGTSASYTYIF